jgi:sigma-B regulation protein RsbU (phosphoserine phosphatase)
MAMVKAAMTTLVEEGADETSLFIRLNDLVLRSTEKRSFMTLAFTIFDLAEGTIRHTNAGHLYPYILRVGDQACAIEVPSLPLGVRPGFEPHTAEAPLREGDAVVYLSDGIVESLDGNGEPFGFERLEKLLTSVAGCSPAEIQETVLDAVALFTNGRPSEDDRTVMVLKFDRIGAVREADVESDVAVAAD